MRFLLRNGLGVVLGVVLVVGYLQWPNVIAAINVLAPPAAAKAQPVAAAPTAQSAQPTQPAGVQPPESIQALENAITGVYERVAPAVVYIVETGAPLTTPFGEFPQQGAGSGVIVDEQGHILTNNHVVAGARRLQVSLADGTTVAGTLVGRDPGNDLALIKVDVPTDKLHVAPLGDSEAVKPGQLAIAIGNPFGLDRTITIGFISSVDRSRANASGRAIRNMLQTDAAINPGNSGGPLLNSKGEVIGITTSIESPVRGSVGVGFAVPINTAKASLKQMLASGEVKHPWLGISGQAVTAELAKELELPTQRGVYVVEVIEGSPAARAGIKGATPPRNRQTLPLTTPKGGDVIVAVDGKQVAKVEDISGYLDTKQVGDTVEVSLLRDDKQLTVDVKLEAWPDRVQ